MYYFGGSPNKKEIEKAVLQSINENSTPMSVRIHLENLGIKAGDVRSAVARLLDKGVISLASDHKLSIK